MVGLKAEVTLNPRTTFSAANLAGGFAPRMPAIAVFPTEDNNVAYPMQKDCNVQGEVTSLYYAFSKDLKNSGSTFAKSTEESFLLNEQGIVQFRGVLGAPPATGTTVGSIKFTWYVRFHGRTRASGPTRQMPQEAKENAEPQASEMSYADLQEHVKSLMLETTNRMK